MNKVNILKKIKVIKKYFTLDFLKYFFCINKNDNNNFNKTYGKIEGNYLDNDQISSIMCDSDNILVIAGAGSGKTTTIIGKIKYLLNNSLCNEKEILLLSFTNASAKEMKLRVKKETNIVVDTFTFHKLGLEILKTNNKQITIFAGQICTLLLDIINELLLDINYTLKFINYVLNHLCGYKNITIDNKVINKKHIDIYNYLLLTNIKFTYNKYFYLNNYGVYIKNIKELKEFISLNIINIQ